MDSVRQYPTFLSSIANSISTFPPSVGQCIQRLLSLMSRSRARDTVVNEGARSDSDTLGADSAGVRWAFASALSVFVVYLLTLPPTVTGEDSGELIAAAYTLGVAHPPGYPIWCIIAHLFTYIPLYSVAWRVALMSAVFGAATVFLLCLVMNRLCRYPWISAAAAMAFGFSGEFWEQAVIAEVYTLNAFFITLCVYLLLRWQASRENKHLYAFALTYGLSLCNHTTMQLLGPVFLIFVLSVEPYFWRHFKLYSRCTLLALAGLSLYAYLPIRSLANPPVDWGNPETWDAFYAHVTRQQYSFALAENARSVTLMAQQIFAFLKLYSWEYAPWLCWLPLFGILPLWSRNRRAFLLILLVAISCSLGLIFILNFTIDRTSLWLNNVFWLPAYMMAAVLMGLGLSWLWEKLSGKFQTLVPVLTLVLAISPLALHYKQNDKSDYFWTRDFALNIFNSLDKNAIYFPTADHATFPLLYFQAVEGIRPDVTLANLYGYPEKSVYAKMPQSAQWDTNLVPSASQQREIEDWVIANSDRPIYFSQYRHPPATLPGATIEMAGLIYRVVKPGEAWEDTGLWEKMTWHTLDAEATHDELTATMVVSDYHYAQGRVLLAERKKKEGFEALDLAAAVMGDEKSTFNNFGSTAIELGYRDEGAKYYMRALAIDPNYVLARRNVAKLYYREGDYGNALKQFKSIADADPRDPDIYFDVVDCLTKLKRTSEALSVLRAVESRFGKHPRVYREIGYVYLNENYDQQTAKYYFTQSLLLNQNQADLQAFVGRTPTADDLQKYYPPGVEIPEEFRKPDPLNPNLPKSPIPGVELPKPPTDVSSEPLPAFPMPDIGAPGGEVPPTPTPGVPVPEVPTPGLPATGVPSTGIPVPPIGGPPVPNAPPVPAGVPQL